ncbi:ribulose-bisphosphate carboxylase large subunit family protein [Paenibacillus rigui]|uniref:Ribulose 1,5-bisphosphate carboxylase n=1 Tax=Paenibacillus rigui TaxID=554312 RepID=A0A229UVV5_9BACL|nr:ribulose-bisphosphate carboxylase large subunit family protein [Paenibacillus rigui]OXM87433.1 ribulose 1,5-bisphosphate carboxylase [Paenibacillus rigui]
MIRQQEPSLAHVEPLGREEVLATYLIETPLAPERAAGVMAGEQSTGTFTAVPGETETLRSRHGARIVSVKPLGTVDAPSLPGAIRPTSSPFSGGGYNRAEVVLAFPTHNFGPSLPNLLSAVAGNLYELQEFSGLRLMDLEFSSSFTSVYTGPRFGIEGTRRLAGVEGRPLIGTIIKPSIGLSIDELRVMVRDLADAGVDFIKDDELNANPPFAPLEQRAQAVMEELERAADRNGKKVMYAFNITGDIEEMKRNHDHVVRAKGTCVMVSINSIGFTGLAYVNRFSEVPIHGHRNQFGYMTRSPLLGIDGMAYQKLCRLAGADHLHVNGLNSKFYESNESVIRSAQGCLTPMLGESGYLTMPVLSSGQSALTAGPTYRALQTTDVIHLAGGGILAHPGGTAAGVESMKLAWEAALADVPLETYAGEHASLQQAIDKFGGNHGKK